MGTIIVGTSLGSYFIGTRFINDPEIVSLIVLSVTVVLCIIAFTITRSFENLAETSRLKSEFINIVSHQLRAPLTNLKWTVELFSSKELKKDAEKEEEYYSSLRENIGRMVELVDDLLIVSKIEQGVYPLRKKELKLESIIDDLISQFKFFAVASNVEIVFKHQPDLPKIFIDTSQIKLAIENLIDNAVRYTKGGGKVEITIGVKGKDLYCRIKDSGVGIPEADKKYIFQKFFRAENILREQTLGSGLGLFISKSIIEKSGGNIWFNSVEGKGTTFYFTLPIK
jgi:signal transduction histidine kinase